MHIGKCSASFLLIEQYKGLACHKPLKGLLGVVDLAAKNHMIVTDSCMSVTWLLSAAKTLLVLAVMSPDSVHMSVNDV